MTAFPAAPARKAPSPKPLSIPIGGIVAPGFEAVREAFLQNFSDRHELGGACCVYYRGRKVVDLWGGLRNEKTGEPWEADTMVLVYSATKGLAAMTLALAHSRAWLDYDEKVARYWPEFAQRGKDTITVRQLLAHQAGLHALDEPLDRRVAQNLDVLAVVLARQEPAWIPGTRQAYHAVTLGFYEGELIRRVDPRHRSLGEFFQDEIATPLGLDFFIRLPASLPDYRLATLSRPGPVAVLRGFPLKITLAGLYRRSHLARALQGSMFAHDERRIYARDLESPAGGGVGTARAMARAYSEFATGGKTLRLSRATLAALEAPAVPPTHGFHDECLMADVRFALGFMKPGPAWPFGREGSYGAPGTGGSLGFADPAAEIGYGYVTSRIGTALTGDPRELALRDALYAALPRLERRPRPPLRHRR
jgi:CubicO group peptidase (beta-lactamase class C family)